MKPFWGYLSLAGSAVIGFTFIPANNSWACSGAHTLIGWFSVFAVIIAIKRHRPEGSFAWYLFSAGVFLNATGIFEDQVLKVIFKITDSPSISDVLWLGLYPGLIWGMLVLIKKRNIRPDMTLLVDTLTITTGASLLMWIFLIHPVTANPSLSIPARLIVCFYPVGDLIVLALMVRLLLAGRNRTSSCWLLIGSLFSFLFADIGWALIGQIGKYSDSIFMVLRTFTNCAFACMGAAALHPSVVTMARPIRFQHPRLGPFLLSALAFATFIGPALLLKEVVSGAIINGAAIAISSIVLFLLVVARMMLSNRQLKNENDLRRKIEEELRVAKEQSDVASRAKSEFLANMSHEIRTPMNAVIGFSELFRATRINEVQKDYIDTVCAGGEVLISLVNDILDISKIESGKVELENIDFDLEALITSALRILRQKAGAKSLPVKVEYPGDMPRNFKGDPTRIRQILMNLVGNAIKFTDKGEISVRVGKNNGNGGEGPQTRVAFDIAVRDTGIGIPAAKQKDIFNAFTQVDSSITRHYGGSGLGLAITKSLVELMKGTIRVESEPGKGSEFIVTLCLARGESDPEKDKSGTRRAARATREILQYKKVSVLVAEDDAVNRKLMRILLQKLGHEADFAENGRDAVKMAGEKKYNVILMDLQMPVMDGLEASTLIRQKSGSNVPIIALTGHVFKEDREKSWSAGINDYLIKPIDVNLLREKIIKWTGYA
jgi:signal transduction histidine kinase/CheY-like chemotaxis protein